MTLLQFAYVMIAVSYLVAVVALHLGHQDRAGFCFFLR